ncbi:MAG: Rrf2 family transcriptional regulator [Anaerolineae bacterium]|nr:Rrf2 family transcriptional regulator [Anaerolineae bacterium]
MFHSTAHLLQTLNDLRLHVLIAMIVLAPELPVSEQRIANMVGCHRDTARNHLQKLEALHLTHQLPGRKHGWTLTSEVEQLPLPLLWRGYSENPAAGAQPQPALVMKSAQSSPPELLKSSAEPDSELLKSSAEPDSELLKSSANVEPELLRNSAKPEKLLNFSAKQPELLKSSAVFAPPIKHVVVVVDPSIPEQQQHVPPELLKSSAIRPAESATAAFFADIGMDEPIPSEFAEYPLEAALGYWFYCLAQKFENPQGYIRRRLEQGHQTPVPDYLKLAKAWLSLTDEQRMTVRWKLEFVTGPRHQIHLPEDFPYLPFAPLLSAWHGARKTNSLFLPDWLFPEFQAADEDEDELDEYEDEGGEADAD